MAGMDVDIFLFQKLDGEIFVGAKGGDAENDVPASLHVQAAAHFLGEQFTVEGGEIFSNASDKLLLKIVAQVQKGGEGELDGRVHGQIRIGDDFQPGEGVFLGAFGAAGDDPGGFHLREAGYFGDAAESKRERGGIGRERGARRAVQCKIEEDFVGDQGEAARGTDFVQPRNFLRVCEMAGGVIGVNDDNGACARR